MNTRLSLLLVVLLFYFQPASAQKFEAGFRFETQVLKTKNNYDNEIGAVTSLYPSCMQLAFAFYPIKNLSLEAHYGKEFGLLDLTDYYYGTEYGFYSKYFLKKYLYLTAGFAFHSNEEKLIHNGGARLNADLAMPAVGLGLKPWEYLGFEFLYQKANLQNISASYGYTKSLISLMKFGVVFGCEIFLF